MTSIPRRTWTIGSDGSAGAAHAAEWAVTQAAGREIRLTLVRGWQIPALEFPLPVETIDEFAPAEACEDFAGLAERASGAGVEVVQELVRGVAAQVLLDASMKGALLIVGSRGLGGFRRLLLGSVSSQCATHASVPTIVVPPTAVVDRPIERIVVGFDGSLRSERALTWALTFAPEGCEVDVVGTWMFSKSGHVAVAQHYGDELDQARHRFNELLDQRETNAGSRLFTRRFAYADPASTLLDAAEGADLLVVGQRGHSGLSAAILGSVSTHLLHHSPIPVAVIPDIE